MTQKHEIREPKYAERIKDKESLLICHSKKCMMFFFEIVNGCDVSGFCSKDLSSSL